MNTKKVIAIGAVAAVIAAIAFLFLHPKPEFDPNAQTGVMPGSQIDLQKELDNSKIAFSVNTSASVKNGVCNLMFENPKSNNKYLSIQIYLDGKEKIYESKLIPAGSYLSDIPVHGSIPKGKHKATVLIKSFDMYTYKAIGQTGAEINITVI